MQPHYDVGRRGRFRAHENKLTDPNQGRCGGVKFKLSFLISMVASVGIAPFLTASFDTLPLRFLPCREHDRAIQRPLRDFFLLASIEYMTPSSIDVG